MKRENIIFDKIVIPYLKAWDLFFEISLPISTSLENRIKTSNKANSDVLYFTPIIGLTLGLSAYVFSYFISVIAGTLFASILCPFIIVLFWELLNNAKDSTFFGSLYIFKNLQTL